MLSVPSSSGAVLWYNFMIQCIYERCIFAREFIIGKSGVEHIWWISPVYIPCEVTCSCKISASNFWTSYPFKYRSKPLSYVSENAENTQIHTIWKYNFLGGDTLDCFRSDIESHCHNFIFYLYCFHFFQRYDGVMKWMRIQHYWSFWRASVDRLWKEPNGRALMFLVGGLNKILNEQFNCRCGDTEHSTTDRNFVFFWPPCLNKWNAMVCLLSSGLCFAFSNC